MRKVKGHNYSGKNGDIICRKCGKLHHHSNRGKKYSEEHKRKIRKSTRKTYAKYSKEERSRKFGTFGDDNPMRNPEIARKNALARLDQKRPSICGDKNPSKRIEVRLKLGKPKSTNKGYIEMWNDLEYRAKQRQTHLGERNPSKRSDVRKKISQKLKSRKITWLDKILVSCRRKPNKKEVVLDSIIQRSTPNQFKYVGDGQVIIDGLCPDWISCNEKKRIIELFGDYWHKNDDGSERVNRFAKYGYSTLIIRENELESEIAIAKLLAFTRGE